MLLPAVALLAAQDICSGAELCFSYGLPNASGNDGSAPCLCGTAACQGWLPREQL